MADGEETELLLNVAPGPDSDFESCNGLFRFSDEGLAGRFITTGHGIKPGSIVGLRLPAELDRQCIHVQIDGTEPGSLIFASARRLSWKNFISYVIDMRARYLLRGVGIDGDDEECVTGIQIFAPSLAQLFNVSRVSYHFPSTGAGGTLSAHVETSPPLIWPTEKFAGIRCSAGWTSSPTPDHAGVSVGSAVSLTIEFKTALKPSDAIRQFVILDRLLSILCFDSVHADKVRLEVLVGTPPTKSWLELQDRRSVGPKKYPHRHELPVAQNHLADFGKLVDAFFDLHDKNSGCFDWYQTVVEEKRFLPDLFNYCVRLAEAFFRDAASGTVDADAIDKLDQIAAVLESNDELSEFVEARIRPIFAGKPSLRQIIATAQGLYPSIPAFASLDPNALRKLRGKDVHGSHSSYSNSDYQLMFDFYRLFVQIFRIECLARCGLDRAEITSSCRNSPKFKGLFEGTER